jgi:hypothetical protein
MLQLEVPVLVAFVAAGLIGAPAASRRATRRESAR